MVGSEVEGDEDGPDVVGNGVGAAVGVPDGENDGVLAVGATVRVDPPPQPQHAHVASMPSAGA